MKKLKYLLSCVCSLFQPKTFKFNGKDLDYKNSRFNFTWANERAIEIPIIRQEILDYPVFSPLCMEEIKTCNYGHKHLVDMDIKKGLNFGLKLSKTLEIGNVLKNYYKGLSHDVVDRDELGTDLYTYKFTKKYDVIVSISTIEHMEDFEKALDIIKGLLNKGGKAIITLPMGYKEYPMWKCYETFSDRYFMRRVSWTNKWEQIEMSCQNGYGSKYPAANSIMIGVING